MVRTKLPDMNFHAILGVLIRLLDSDFRLFASCPFPARHLSLKGACSLKYRFRYQRVAQLTPIQMLSNRGKYPNHDRFSIATGMAPNQADLAFHWIKPLALL